MSYEEARWRHIQRQRETPAEIAADSIPAPMLSDSEREDSLQAALELMITSGDTAGIHHAESKKANEAAQRAIEEASAAHLLSIESTAASCAASCAWNVLRAASPCASVAQRFHRDGLHCIFAFLPIRQLPTVLCCRAWLNAASKQRSRGITYT
jgi:hypothetical protein